MRSSKQPLFVPLGSGLKTDVDPKLLPLGKTLELQNARQQRTGEVVARPGSTGLPSPANTPWSLGTHKGALAVIGSSPTFEPLDALSVPDGAHDFITNGGISSAGGGPVSLAYLKIAADAIQPDVAIGAGGVGTFYAVAYANVTGTTVHMDLFDIETGHRRVAFQTTPANPLAAYRCIVNNGCAVLVYETTAVPSPIVFVSINLTTFVQNTVTLAGVAAGGPVESARFDVMVKDASNISVAFVDNTVSFVTAIDFNPLTLANTQWRPLTAAAANIGTPSVLCWVLDLGASGKQALAEWSGANGVRVHWAFPTSGVTRQATNTYQLDATAAAGSPSMTSYTVSNDATGAFEAAYTTSASPATNYKTTISNRIGGVISTATVVYRSLALQSRAFMVGNQFFALMGFRSTTQGSRYLMRLPNDNGPNWPKNPLATIALDQGVETLFDSGASLSAVASLNAASRTIALGYLLRSDLGTAASGYNSQAAAVQLVTVSFQSTPNQTFGVPREYADSMLVPNATPLHFDGVSYAEMGTAYFPEQPSFSGITAGANIYQYKLVYSYVDAQGRLWRSADSFPKATTGSAAIGGGGSVTVACPTLRATARTNIIIEVYRTAVGDSVTFQKVGTVANDFTVDSVNFTDSVTDAVQATGEFLYTNGGILANDTLPGIISWATNGGRALGISMEDRQTIWPSDIPATNNGPRWSQTTVFDVRDQHGDMTCIAALDDKFVAFKGDAIYAISGDGPDELGRGGFSVQLVATGIGANNPQSVLETKDGVIFKSTSTRAGFFIIDRGLSIQYIGADVQKYLTLTTTGAILDPQLSQARFFSLQGTTLVLDLVTMIWGIDTGQPTNTAISWNGRPTYATVSNGLLIEDNTATIWQEFGSNYTEYVESPWLQLSALRTFERFYRIQGVGETIGDHTLTVSLYKDFETTPFTTETLAITLAGLPKWDWELRYSSKMEALKVALAMTGNSGKAKVSGVSLIIGTKGTLRPFPAANRAT